MHRIWSTISLLTGRRVYTRCAGARDEIYLTFDDGPHPEHTPHLLELLARHDARATFFLQGSRVAGNEHVVRDLVAAGHRLGNHSFSHTSFVSLSVRGQREEIERTDDVLRQFDGRTSHDIRPPHGRPTLGTIFLCAAGGRRLALWTHDSLDYRLPASAVVERLWRAAVRPGDILLFHDDGPASAGALARLLPRWRDAGLKFGTL